MKKKSERATAIELSDILPYASWVTPVPLKRAEFVATRSASNLKYGVVVDHARAKPFARMSELAGKQYLRGHGFADLQLNLHSASGVRGSGRSLHFEGRYLKGVGLTGVNVVNQALMPDSGYHASGHLLPSAGIREYLIAAYLRAHDMSEIALDCDDVLFQRNDAERRRVADNIYAAAKSLSAPLPIDRALSAVTVKSGNFARYTNVLWVAANYISYSDPSLGLTELLALLGHFSLSPKQRARGELGEYEIEETFDNFRLASERTFLWLLKANLLGLSWGSMNNNFALDGRYVDLETPCVFGAFHLGAWQRSGAERLRYADLLTLIESYRFVAQFRRFCAELQMHLEAIVRRRRMDFPKALDAVFFRDVERAFSRLVVKRSRLFDDELVHRIVRQCVLENVHGLSAAKRGRIESLLQHAQQGKISGAANERVVASVQLDSNAYLFPESPFATRTRCVPKVLAGEFAIGADAIVFKDAFEHVVCATRPADAAARLHAAEAMIRSRVAKREIHIDMTAFEARATRAGTGVAVRASKASHSRSRA